jgi:hypothetical protein
MDERDVLVDTYAKIIQLHVIYVFQPTLHRVNLVQPACRAQPRFGLWTPYHTSVLPNMEKCLSAHSNGSTSAMPIKV